MTTQGEAIAVACSCGKRYRVAAAAAATGRVFNCPVCGAALSVPAPVASAGARPQSVAPLHPQPPPQAVQSTHVPPAAALAVARIPAPAAYAFPVIPVREPPAITVAPSSTAAPSQWVSLRTAFRLPTTAGGLLLCLALGWLC